MIKHCYNAEKNDAYKASWLSMVSNLETKESLEKFGFQIGSRVFATANRRRREGKAGMFEKPTGRPRKVTLEELLKIRDFLKQKDVSFPAAQKTISHRIFDPSTKNFLTPKKVMQPCFYLEHSRATLYLTYRSNGGILKSTKFMEVLKRFFPQYKKAKKETDLCSYCEMGKKLQEQLEALITRNCKHKHTVDECDCVFDTALNADKLAMKGVLEVVKKHRHNKNEQRNGIQQTETKS